MTAKELHTKVMRKVDKWYPGEIYKDLTLVGSGQVNEIYNNTGQDNLYYQWLHCAMEVIKPRQVVELGAAAGISTILMATALPKDSRIISVDCDPQAWRWMNKEYKNVTKVLGDDLDLSIYPKDVDLYQTDFWFIDSLHTEEQLREEVKLYCQFWKKGTIIAFDDIHLGGLDKVWNSIVADKLDITNPCHYSGWGIAII